MRLRLARGAGGKRGEGAPPSASERGWGPASISDVASLRAFAAGDQHEPRLRRGRGRQREVATVGRAGERAGNSARQEDGPSGNWVIGDLTANRQ